MTLKREQPGVGPAVAAEGSSQRERRGSSQLSMFGEARRAAGGVRSSRRPEVPSAMRTQDRIGPTIREPQTTTFEKELCRA